MTDADARGRVDPPPARHLLHRLQGRLARLFAQQVGADEQDAPARRARLLLGQELLHKLEEQVVLPALQRDAADIGDARVAARRQAIGDALREIELMRDLELLLPQLAGTPQDLAWRVLGGLAQLHAARVDRLLAEAPSGRVDEPALAHEMADLLARWQHEWRTQGGIEDEERDPVGLPPR